METTINPELKKFQTLLQRYVILLELLNAKQQIEDKLKKIYPPKAEKGGKKKDKDITTYPYDTINGLITGDLTKELPPKDKIAEKDYSEWKTIYKVNKNLLKAFLSNESKGWKFLDDIKMDPSIPNLSIDGDTITFGKLSGYGHKGNDVQKYIADVDNYTPWGRIGLNLCTNGAKVCNENATLLHWLDTGNNIVAKWKDAEGKDVDTEDSEKATVVVEGDKPKTMEDLIAGLKTMPNYITKLSLKLQNNSEESEELSVDSIFAVLDKDPTQKENVANYLDKYSKHCTSIQILLDRYNIVYTGAPGTGKTYLAKEMAAQLVAGLSYSELDPKVRDEQIAFVQFHPSYDYSNFVEGLHSYERGDNQIGFRREDGIFKEFCKKAYKEWDAVKKLVDKLTDTGIINKELKIEDGQFNRTATVNIPNKEDGEEDEHYATRALANKYVFIIDEINRGELSKIFGELFYSIDPGYRGENGRVKTQYQKLVTYELDDNGKIDTGKPDAFKEGFFVPENVYIIGTMNEIDRSVEPMDFAVRRRFTWIDVKPEDRMGMWGTNLWRGEAEIAMNNLNAGIRLIDLLGEDYCIGPAYFLNPPLDTKGKIVFDSLWNLRIKTILKEYFRGLPAADINTYMETLEKAFKCKDLIDSKKTKTFEEFKAATISKNNSSSDEDDE